MKKVFDPHSVRRFLSPAPTKSTNLTFPPKNITNVQTLRFSNYIMIFGFYESDELLDLKASIFVHEKIHIPENFILDIVLNDRLINLGPEINASRRRYFLIITWINDAYKSDFFDNDAVKLTLSDESHQFGAVLGSPRDGEYTTLIALCSNAGHDPLWENRLVLEIMRDAPLDMRRAFVSSLLQELPGDAAIRLIDTHFGNFSEAQRLGMRLDTLCQDIERRGAAYVGAAQASSLVAMTESVDVSIMSDEDIGHYLGALLTCKAEDKACELAIRVIRARQGARNSLAAIFKVMLPERTRWWFYSILLNQHLGDEQIVNALTLLGDGARAEGKVAMARLLFAAAVALSADANAAMLNAGWMELDQGDVAAAFRNFRGVQRHRAGQGLTTPWPSADNIP
jgi:hypothetical protein